MIPLLLLRSAVAAVPEHAAQERMLEEVRAQVAGQVHLDAFNLVDELVYGWKTEPPFEAPTSVVLAEVTVPVGLGTGMRALLENHVATVLAQNPTTNVKLVHCPACTAVVVHSGPEGTVVSRGIDDPAVLAELGSDTGRHALFLDVEAEGAYLVLRARLTGLTPDLPIVWSHTLATSTSTPALLRKPSDLKSADEARDEYLDALHDRGNLAIPLRVAIRSYARPNSEDGIPPPPFLWLQTGLEMSPTDAKAWTASVLVGYSFIPQAYQGVMAQARVHRLITGKVRSVTRPDLYGFVGAAATSVWGPATGPFLDPNQPNSDQTSQAAIAYAFGTEVISRSIFGGFQVGLDLRVGNRMGMSAYLETLPDYNESPNIGSYIYVFLPWQSLGTEVTFWF